MKHTVVSKLITDRIFSVADTESRYVARRITFHYRDISLGISVENLSLPIENLS